MKIRDLRCIPVWGGDRLGRDYLFVVVETDEGVSGLGEAGVHDARAAVCGAVEHLKELLVGEDPFRMDSMHSWGNREGKTAGPHVGRARRPRRGGCGCAAGRCVAREAGAANARTQESGRRGSKQRGLPEDWEWAIGGMPRGAFSTGGREPGIADRRVRCVKRSLSRHYAESYRRSYTVLARFGYFKKAAIVFGGRY